MLHTRSVPAEASSFPSSASQLRGASRTSPPPDRTRRADCAPGRGDLSRLSAMRVLPRARQRWDRAPPSIARRSARRRMKGGHTSLAISILLATNESAQDAVSAARIQLFNDPPPPSSSVVSPRPPAGCSNQVDIPSASEPSLPEPTTAD